MMESEYLARVYFEIPVPLILPICLKCLEIQRAPYQAISVYLLFRNYFILVLFSALLSPANLFLISFSILLSITVRLFHKKKFILFSSQQVSGRLPRQDAVACGDSC